MSKQNTINSLRKKFFNKCYTIIDKKPVSRKSYLREFRKKQKYVEFLQKVLPALVNKRTVNEKKI